MQTGPGEIRGRSAWTLLWLLPSRMLGTVLLRWIAGTPDEQGTLAAAMCLVDIYYTI